MYTILAVRLLVTVLMHKLNNRIEAFADNNYQLWDDPARRPELKLLYKAESELSFESAVTSFKGGDDIYNGIFVSHLPALYFAHSTSKCLL